MTLSINALDMECFYVECHYAESRYAECRYAECHGALIWPQLFLYDYIKLSPFPLYF